MPDSVTPQERHADAVEAAHEWRDQQREQMPLPHRGDRITIVWPGGADFVMEFLHEDRRMCGAPPGWTFLHGKLLDPPNWRGWVWSFMVHWVPGENGNAGVWSMLPKGGKLSDVQ